MSMEDLNCSNCERIAKDPEYAARYAAYRESYKAGVADVLAGRIGPPIDFTKPEYQDEELDK